MCSWMINLMRTRNNMIMTIATLTNISMIMTIAILTIISMIMTQTILTSISLVMTMAMHIITSTSTAGSFPRFVT